VPNQDRDDTKIETLARRVMARCDRLALCSEEPDHLTRTFLSPPMREVHADLREWMHSCHVTVRVDALGNLIGRYPAAEEPAPALLLGSHLDTVPNAGRYDGVVGVLLALAVVEAFDARFRSGESRLPFALEVIGFSEEEGVRFRTPYLGSRALSGQWEPSLLALRDKNGVRLDECLDAFGQDAAAIGAAVYSPSQVVGYVEAHIEQGPVLEKQALPVGIVSAVAGQTRCRLRFMGRAAHAGTTPMGLMRQDALVGAAEFIGAVEAAGQATPGLVATVGAITVLPNASNVIPGAAQISLDVRHARNTVREEAVAGLLEQAQRIAGRRGLHCQTLDRYDFAAVPMDADLRTLLAEAVEELGFPAHEMVSGAGHDAVMMAQLAPSAMLFLRGPNGGISHHPDETVFEEDVATALRVLVSLVEKVAASKEDENE